jgi:hypothetical protein
MKIFQFILGLFLLPFYPLLKKMAMTGEKIRIGENIVVITEHKRGNKKRIQ